jgi:ABC-type bacteriocin/lantibiotic exporter with double-glycine peptidase domain
MISLFVGLYMFFCRDYRHFHGIERLEDIYWLDAFLNRFYFVLTTFTTIGYGDITPRTKRARLLTIFIILLIMVVVLKAFDGMISTYHGVFDKYNKDLATDAKKIESDVTK